MIWKAIAITAIWVPLAIFLFQFYLAIKRDDKVSWQFHSDAFFTVAYCVIPATIAVAMA